MVALSDLLRYANLPFTFSLDRNAAIVASKSGSDSYSVAEMSDGERNALLLAAEVLTVPSGTLILIDEPELHLHRSIISSLLTGLFSNRSDCMFVISTHEVMLPIENPASKILLVRGCTYQNGKATAWDVDLVDSPFEIDEDLKKDVLGARRDVVFVEGERGSLDMPLYSLILPNVSIIPRGTRKNVEDAVRSIRAAEELHWIRAYGIVDNDGQNTDGMEGLTRQGIYPIDAYSVESIYYDSKIQEKVARRRSKLTGDDASSRIRRAKDLALEAVKSHIDNLAELKAERKLREEMLKLLPNRKTSSLRQPIHIDLDAPSVLECEQKALSAAIDRGDLDTIIRRYPIRQTGVLSRISKSLGFDNKEEYQRAVLQLLKDDNTVLMYVRGLLGDAVGHIMGPAELTTTISEPLSKTPH